MRKSYLLAGAMVVAVGLAGLTAAIIPVAAESEGVSGACAPTATPGTATLNLDAVPIQPVAGKQSVRGVAGDDDEDCGGSADRHGEDREYEDND